MKQLFVLTFIFWTLLMSGQDAAPNRFIVTDKVDTLLAKRSDCFLNTKTSFRYYHIQLYNGQSINRARSIKANFRSKFPGTYAIIEWESPEYKVWAGNYASKLVADQALLKIRKKFPNAFIVNPKK